MNNFNFLFNRNSSKCGLFCNRYLISSGNALSLKCKIEGIVWHDQTTPAKETIVSVTQMHYILTWKYLDNRDSRSHNICVSSDKIGFFLSFIFIFFFLSYALFGNKNENIENTNCSISTYPAKKITLACYTYLCLAKVTNLSNYVLQSCNKLILIHEHQCFIIFLHKQTVNRV